MSAPDRRRARALQLLDTCEELASLSVPASAAHREAVLKAAALTEAFAQIMDAAEGVDPLRALCVVMVQRGAEAGLDYEATFAVLLDAFENAAKAHASTIDTARHVRAAPGAKP